MKKKPLYLIALLVLFLLFSSCLSKTDKVEPENRTSYFDNLETGIQTGGVKMISINTPKGKFNVWTKRVGNNPTIKVLLLNGGPGCTHE
jgi:proline iminopeptidase